MKYFWSFTDNEVWYDSEETIKDCIEAAKEDNEDECEIVMIGTLEEFHPTIDAGEVIERLSEGVYDELGECAEEWLTGVNKKETDDLSERLTAVFREWLKETDNYPGFGGFSEIVEYDLVTGKKIGEK